MSDMWILPAEMGKFGPVKMHHHKYMKLKLSSFKVNCKLLLIQFSHTDVGLLLGAQNNPVPDQHGPCRHRVQRHPQEELLRPGL